MNICTCKLTKSVASTATFLLLILATALTGTLRCWAAAGVQLSPSLGPAPALQSVPSAEGVGQTPGVSMKLSHQTLSMHSMSSTSVVVTVTPTGGVSIPASAAGAAASVVSGLPVGVLASWSQPTVASGVVTWTLTLTGTPSAVASSATLNLSAQVADANSGAVYAASEGILLAVSFTAPTLTFSPALTQVPVVQGTNATDTFSFIGGGSFQGNVSLSISGLPSTVTASWSSSSVALNSLSGSSVLTLNASTTATVNQYSFTVVATGDGLTVSKNFSVQVQQAPGLTMKLSHQSLSMQSMTTTSVVLTATPIGGVVIPAGAAGASAAIISGLPTGITAAWSGPVVSGSSVAWTLTLNGTPNAIASAGSLNLATQVTDANTGIAYAASAAIPLSVSFTAPTLNLSTATTHVPLVQGASASDLFTLTSGGSFQGNVTMAVSGLPSGVTGSWSSSTVTPASGTGSSTLTLVASPSAISNWFSFTVTATGDGLTATQSYVVEVKPSTGVQIQLSQTSLSIEPQGTATLSVTATPVNGISVAAGAVGASAAIASGLPGGVTAVWSTPTMTTSGAVNWTLTLTAETSAATSSDPIKLAVQITDQSSGLVYATSPSFTLLVSLLANVSIGNTPGAAISPTFMGLSQEWNDAQSTMGDAATGVNAIYRQLLTNLTSYGSGPINLRIGGDSTDATGEPTSTTITPFVELAEAMGAQFELGVNLGSNNVNLATDQATAYVSQMPSGSLLALEIGNEPDEYYKNGLRPATYTVQNYFSDFLTWQQNITPVLPSGTKLMGAAWAFLGTLQANAQNFAIANSASLNLFSQHSYVTSPSNNPAGDFLLTPAAATSVPSQVAAAVIASHAQGLPFRMGETGSVSDGGLQSISCSFSSALWAIDSMFQYVNVGVDGVNWFATNGSFNSPFFFTNTTSKGIITHTLNAINPLYYGLVFFQEATQNGSKLLPVALSTPANLTAWATVDSSETPRLTLINKDEALTGTVNINVPGYSQATVLRLAAPSYSSTAGVTFAGQTFDGSPDGKWQGTQAAEAIEGANGVFQLTMPTTSAALVIFTK